MIVVLGYSKGEVFVVGLTSSRRKASKWVDEHPHGIADEYDYVEVQSAYTGLPS